MADVFFIVLSIIVTAAFLALTGGLEKLRTGVGDE